eukprot:jgi/Hompol1/1690/HPOL_001422-RA
MTDKTAIADNEPLLGALETGQPSSQQPLSCRALRHRYGFSKLWLFSGVATLLAAVALSTCISNAFAKDRPKPVRNVILMISDGFGPASQTLARNYNQYVGKLPIGAQLALDTILVGASRTRSSSSFVTDSAAGATAFACGLKSYNGAIGVDSDSVPCGTVLEAAKERGMFTGLVATSRITHATPASFSSHVGSRNDEDSIAMQQIGRYSLGRRVDLMFGGGLCHFIPNTSSTSCRPDGLDVLGLAEQSGWKIGTTRGFFDSIEAKQSSLPVLALFTPDHMSYNIDRDPAVEPSLVEMASKAMDVLHAASRKHNTGFFLMIEGSRIDMAGHTNDPATHVHEILQYNDAINAAKKFVDSNPDTVLISVSDHETGGLSVGHQLGPLYPIYEWFPEALTGVKHSAEFMARQIKEYKGPNIGEFITGTVFAQWLNNTDPNPEDVALLSDATQSIEALENYIGTMVSNWASIGWSTHGHSAVDVNLYAYGANKEELHGNHENTDIGDFIARNLRLDLAKITKRLKESWTSNGPNRIKPAAKHSNFDEKHFHANQLP